MLLASAASIMILLIVRSLAARSRSMQRHARRVVVIGTGEEGAELAQLVIEHPEAAMKLVGVVGNRTMADRNGLGPALLGDVDRLASILSSASIDMAIVTPTGFRAPQYRRIMAAIEDARVDAYLSSGVGRIAAPRYQVSSLVHEPFLSIGWDEPSALQQLARRAIDIAGAGVGLLLASPVMLVAALAVKLYDRGPVLYRSGRIGQDRQPFGMLKFRSMRPDADQLKNDLAQRNERSGPLFKVSNDPRVTPVGRLLRETSIDELPQLINVLRGDMSLVGPRPALPEEHERFDDELMARFGVRPGITGLWQVEARSNAEFGAYRRLDLHYVANRSLLLDAQIIVATVVQILTSVLLLPVSLIARRQFVDQISDHAVAPVIDLRAAGESINELPPPTSVSAGN
ncbi:MAG: sugar transferase [Acidimicrobiales bacterium]